MYLRIFSAKKDREILFHVNSIWKIEVFYNEQGDNGELWKTCLMDGITNPEAVRTYRIYVGSDEYLLKSNPECPVMQVIEDIYKKAIK